MKPPIHALTLWSVGDTVYVEFPGAHLSHQISFKLSELTLSAFREVLRKRAVATDHRISMPGTPTQWDFTQQIRAAVAAKPKLQKFNIEDLIDDL